jgi:hypothetical protein
MSNNYWLDLFTGKTWKEFIDNGANISGFRKSRLKSAKRIQPGDYLLCYLTGISRFVGLLGVLSEAFLDATPIWEDEEFPVRFKVKAIYQLNPEIAIPVTSLKDKLSIFRNLKSPNAWTGSFRGSPVAIRKEDGEVIVAAMEEAVAHPVRLDFDEKKLWRRPKKYDSKFGKVTVPPPDKPVTPTPEPEGQITHEEIQYTLLKLGSDMGLDVWVARNDQNKSFNGTAFKNVPNLRTQLPRQFDEATNKTIEFIDVLWLQGDAIVAAFEVEHTTAIYSGLLRMSDLVSMQPNINLKIYLVAPDEKRSKIFDEISRPTFARLRPPLPRICKFIPYSKLLKEVKLLGPKLKFMKPEMIEALAESCEDKDR